MKGKSELIDALFDLGATKGRTLLNEKGYGKHLGSIQKTLGSMDYKTSIAAGAAGLGALDLAMGNDWNPMTGIMMGAGLGAAGTYLGKGLNKGLKRTGDIVKKARRGKSSTTLKSNTPI